MIDTIREKLRGISQHQAKVNTIREFLQHLTLKLLADKGFSPALAFVGGTALRVLFGLRRYSEDLDFSLWEATGYDFPKLVKTLQREFANYGFSLEVKSRSAVVDSAMLQFNSVLQELGLSAHKKQKLSVKLEIDTNPPLGAASQTTPVNRDFLFTVRHYDLPSLMAGKLHALMCRKFVKGRDYYDLLWYLSRGEVPNLILLQNALLQTEQTAPDFSKVKWETLLLEKLRKVDFKKVQGDVKNFLVSTAETELLVFESFERLLEKNVPSKKE